MSRRVSRHLNSSDFIVFQLLLWYNIYLCLHNLKHNKNITLLTVEKLCRILDCEITDIVCFIDEEPAE
ncbi:MAG: helix-turn-helix domain-containing protein [Agathobacter sp.]|nr:helix-turn-helix domain-containing protein [Agathobacter sp.]MBQ2283761.1 helix-turn-helix domain-containing protein [Agathobacter sp.]